MRKLSAEEQSLWNRVVETVRPLRSLAPMATAPVERDAPPPKGHSLSKGAVPLRPTQPNKPTPGTTLDGSWDRRLSRGLVVPDAIVDLHGHNLDTAWALLDRRLEQSIAHGDRLFLLVTGKPPSEQAAKRGAIRAAVGDWLHASRHAGDIAAVRNAHPRHGGAGALYIVLRRRRARP